MSTNGYWAARRKQTYDACPECSLSSTYPLVWFDFLHICRVDGDILPNALERTEVPKSVWKKCIAVELQRTKENEVKLGADKKRGQTLLSARLPRWVGAGGGVIPPHISHWKQQTSTRCTSTSLKTPLHGRWSNVTMTTTRAPSTACARTHA